MHDVIDEAEGVLIAVIVAAIRVRCLHSRVTLGWGSPSTCWRWPLLSLSDTGAESVGCCVDIGTYYLVIAE